MQTIFLPLPQVPMRKIFLKSGQEDKGMITVMKEQGKEKITSGTEMVQKSCRYF